jgi:hypothetical protein
MTPPGSANLARAPASGSPASIASTAGLEIDGMGFA